MTLGSCHHAAVTHARIVSSRYCDAMIVSSRCRDARIMSSRYCDAMIVSSRYCDARIMFFHLQTLHALTQTSDLRVFWLFVSSSIKSSIASALSSYLIIYSIVPISHVSALSITSPFSSFPFTTTRDQFGPKFQVQGVVPYQPFFLSKN